MPFTKSHHSNTPHESILTYVLINILRFRIHLQIIAPPIIINNSCASWRELAQRFTFANARAYVGTLFPIATTEVHDVVIGVLGKHFEKTLPHAFWSAQNGVYGDSVCRPYIVTGVYPQRLRVTSEDTPGRIYTLMQSALKYWSEYLKDSQGTEEDKNRVRTIVDFYRHEIQTFGTNRIALKR